jgi:hypothetical protein
VERTVFHPGTIAVTTTAELLDGVAVKPALTGWRWVTGSA